MHFFREFTVNPSVDRRVWVRQLFRSAPCLGWVRFVERELGPATMKIRPEPGFNMTQRTHVAAALGALQHAPPQSVRFGWALNDKHPAQKLGSPKAICVESRALQPLAHYVRGG